MNETRRVAASLPHATATEPIRYYANRRCIEYDCRDPEDLCCGMGVDGVHVNSPERRNRLWRLNALAVVPLTLLGAASEAVGQDRLLKTNTVKRRTRSLFRQGGMLDDLIATMPEVGKAG
jgi:hypothetical protein